jgi:hypothetical protein
LNYCSCLLSRTGPPFLDLQTTKRKQQQRKEVACYVDIRTKSEQLVAPESFEDAELEELDEEDEFER